jgi:hypothetical protein
VSTQEISKQPGIVGISVDERGQAVFVIGPRRFPEAIRTAAHILNTSANTAPSDKSTTTAYIDVWGTADQIVTYDDLAVLAHAYREIGLKRVGVRCMEPLVEHDVAPQPPSQSPAPTPNGEGE